LVIEVRLYASLRCYRPSGSDSGLVTVDVPDSITLGELLDELEIDSSKINVSTINGTDGDSSNVLYDGDRVELFPPDFNTQS